ncbi:LytR/AlgR family response regulator transcription factor [Natroniella sp. ANB-PHB2]|uniref:LytR/AlgR family response regulator transcription factor n=1 Tax=Natroniella sp. ANB-PHB2 TaxID=3384444 RepID=UPI0038D4D8AD
MQKLKVVIVEDEPPARDELAFLLNQVESIKIIGQLGDGIKALEFIRQEDPDIVFLDIQLPGLSGLQIGKKIQEMDNEPPMIIFSTAYDKYAVEAFEVNAIDYLLKPYEEERLKKTIERIRKDYFQLDHKVIKSKFDVVFNKLAGNNLSNKIDKFPVEGKRGRIKLIKYNDIIALYTKDGKVYAKTYQNEYRVTLNLTKAEEKLADDLFLRIHRSYLINLYQVKEVIPWFKGQYKVVMNDESEMRIPVSRSKVNKLKEIFSL